MTTVATEPIGHGQVGANYRLLLQGEGPLPATLVAKMGAGDDRSMVANGYRNEVGVLPRPRPDGGGGHPPLLVRGDDRRRHGVHAAAGGPVARGAR